jgi:hypothetical protein
MRRNHNTRETNLNNYIMRRITKERCCHGTKSNRRDYGMSSKGPD